MAATKFDFHKVAENEDVEVYQSMQLLETKENKATGIAPRKYAPQEIRKINGATLDSALELFAGMDVNQVTISKVDGITVRVRRAAGDTYEPPEPGVERLQAKKVGGDK